MLGRNTPHSPTSVVASRDENGAEDTPNRGQQLVRVPVDELKQEEATE